MSAPLPLRDVHPGIAPGWWPPAPGWWMLAAVVLVALGVAGWWWLRRRRRNVALAQLFDTSVDRAESPSAQVAVMSELLRRAARRRDPAADRLQGEEWLLFLDQGLPDNPFSTGAGVLLLEGGFRADVAGDAAAELRMLARRRYLTWMRQR